ncbi:hypothetical protein OAV88_00870 [bacterium]|nr:hypothetical protein [bacterium]
MEYTSDHESAVYVRIEIRPRGWSFDIKNFKFLFQKMRGEFRKCHLTHHHFTQTPKHSTGFEVRKIVGIR